jgi:hypothetical protein
MHHAPAQQRMKLHLTEYQTRQNRGGCRANRQIASMRGHGVQDCARETSRRRFGIAGFTSGPSKLAAPAAMLSSEADFRPND